MPNDATDMIDDLFKQSSDSFESIHFSNNSETQLQSIVAIDSTVLGPALGGCRFVHYHSTNAAVRDALNLAKGMTYKAAFNRLPFGGGKAVIVLPNRVYDRRALMASYGDFIESLGGQFITAVDSGTCTDDMDIVAQRTNHVVCNSKLSTGSGDPSPHTARGVLRGIQAACVQVLNRNNLEGVHVLIQGIGHVGYHLASYLFEQGAKISICDVNQKALEQCQDEFSAKIIQPDNVFSTPCDVFSPCALGQIINENSIEQFQTKIIAGAANNQLSETRFGEMLRQKNIIFVPDFVINSGGLLQIAYVEDTEKLINKINNIYDSVLEVLQIAAKQKKCSNLIAIEIAQKYLLEHKNRESLSVVQGR